MMKLEAAIAQFWEWTAAHEEELIHENKEQTAVKALLERLETMAEGLVGELTTDYKEQKWLIISANGKKALLPLVMKIVEAAPKMEVLQVRGFRPRQNGHVALVLRGKRLASNEMFFTARKRNHMVDVTVYGPELTNDEMSLIAVRLLLDHMVGEYEAATKLGKIEVREMRFEKEQKKGLEPLIHLPGIVDQIPNAHVN